MHVNYSRSKIDLRVNKFVNQYNRWLNIWIQCVSITWIDLNANWELLLKAFFFNDFNIKLEKRMKEKEKKKKEMKESLKHIELLNWIEISINILYNQY